MFSRLYGLNMKMNPEELPEQSEYRASATGPAALKFSWTFPTVPSFNLNSPCQEAGKNFIFLMIKVGLTGKARSRSYCKNG